MIVQCSSPSLPPLSLSLSLSRFSISAPSSSGLCRTRASFPDFPASSAIRKRIRIPFGEGGAWKRGRIQEVPLTTHVARHSSEHCRAALRGKRAPATTSRPFNRDVTVVTFGLRSLERVRRRRRTCPGPLVSSANTAAARDCARTIRISLGARHARRNHGGQGGVGARFPLADLTEGRREGSKGLCEAVRMSGTIRDAARRRL